MKKLYATGLVIGRFDPLHKGHSFLIETALAQTDNLNVIVCERAEQSIPVELRARWIREIHPRTHVHIARDIIKDGDHQGWADYVKKILGHTPEALFTSEEYGERYASILGSNHVLVDKERINIPISATMVRNDPKKYAVYLDPIVLDFYI